jgi:3-hydroxy-9,10-secoandrosta-1,3,5(10)-triene-9,17-dione monooxygenase reductase component
MAQAPPGGLATTIDPELYRSVLGRYATGVTVVTTFFDGPRGGQPWGTTVSAFSSVSLEPPLVLVCIGRERSIHPVIARTGLFAVNILAEDSQALSDCFAGAPSTLPRSAFCDAPYRLGGTGMPLLDDALATIEASVERVVEAGDHTIYLARVLELRARDDDAWPLLYFRGRYLRIEHAATEELRGKPDAS